MSVKCETAGKGSRLLKADGEIIDTKPPPGMDASALLLKPDGFAG
jgi:hypothetical protein